MNPTNEQTIQRAAKVLPGGVNSPVRAYGAVGGVPTVHRRARGAYVEDLEGQRYLDFVGSWGPLILGHAQEEIVEEVARVAANGLTFGAPSLLEVELAEKIVSWYPGLEQVRCVSSGTEATMSAIRLARGATGRDRIVKFSGCYHGHADHLLVAAGSGLTTFGQPSSEGVPGAFAELTTVLPLDDTDRIEKLFQEQGAEIAAVIVEPVPANNGLLVPRREFLETLRRVCSDHGTLLIFDEVITGFRLARGGAAEHFDIVPDLVTFGKVIGGGMPVGAFGGGRELTKHLAPEGGVYQAGTLSGNPVAMAAGKKTLEIMERDQGWELLEQRGRQLEERMAPVIKEAPFPLQLVRLGSLFWFAAQQGDAPRSALDIDASAADHYGKMFHGLKDRGVLLAPSAYEVGFLSLAHTEQDLDVFAGALKDCLDEIRAAP